MRPPFVPICSSFCVYNMDRSTSAFIAVLFSIFKTRYIMQCLFFAEEKKFSSHYRKLHQDYPKSIPPRHVSCQ